ncbi:MAG: hypothetical protein EAZ89_13445 [Bacteroidetes bacterium]|nr:MAG: hypothetical protein EAZ89_13445 [Bacteroidota bacterium]
MKAPETGPAKASFWRNALTLSAGTFSAQALGLLTLLISARLYSDEAVGISGIFIFTVIILAVAMNGGYEMAIMLPKDDSEAFHLTQLSLGITAVAALALLVLAALLPAVPGIEALGDWRFALPLSAALEGTQQALRVWLNRRGAYKRLAMSRLLRALASGVVAVGLGLSHEGPSGLILGWIAGQAAAVLFLLSPELLSQRPALARLRALAREYNDFPRYGMLSAWLNTAARFLPVYFFTSFYGSDIAGQFTQTDRVLSLPATLFSMAVGEVFYAKASEAARESDTALAHLTRRTFFRLLSLALPYLLLILLLGPWLFAWVLGPQWALAGQFSRALIPWMAMVFVAAPLSYMIDVRRKLGPFLGFNVCLFAVRLLSLLWACQHLSPESAMMVFGASGVCMVLLQLLWTLRLGRAL